MNEPMHRKNKESFGIQTRAPYGDGASKRGGTYISNQVRMYACHLTSKKKKKKHLHIFLNCYRKILNEVHQDGGKRKKHCGNDDNKESVLIME